jgi:hypothetical protein
MKVISKPIPTKDSAEAEEAKNAARKIDKNSIAVN